MKEIAPLADVFHCSEEEAAVLTVLLGLRKLLKHSKGLVQEQHWSGMSKGFWS
jgi:hypothetical protein